MTFCLSNMKSEEMTTLTRGSIFSESLFPLVPAVLCDLSGFTPFSSSSSRFFLISVHTSYEDSSENQKVSLSIGLILEQLSRQWHSWVSAAALTSAFVP